MPEHRPKRVRKARFEDRKPCFGGGLSVRPLTFGRVLLLGFFPVVAAACDDMVDFLTRSIYAWFELRDDSRDRN